MTDIETSVTIELHPIEASATVELQPINADATVIKGEKGDKGDKGDPGTTTFSGLTGSPRDNAALEGELEALETAVASKADSATVSAHVADTSNPHGVTAAQVGSPTTAEMNTALSGKANAVHTHEISDVNGLTEALADGGSGWLSWARR